MVKIIYAALFLAAAVITLIFSIISRKRTEPIAKCLYYTLGVAGIMCLVYTAVIILPPSVLREACYNIVFICVDLVLIGMCRFVQIFIKHEPSKRILFLTNGFAAIDIVLIFTNIFHHIVISYDTFEYNGEYYVKLLPHTWYNIHLCFSYLMVLFMFGYLIVKMYKVSGAYKEKYIVVLVILFFIVGVDFLFIFEIIYMPVDFSFALYGIGTIFLYYYTFLYNPRIMIRRSRIETIDNITTPIVLFDNDRIMIDYNKCCKELFEFNDNLKGKLSVQEFIENTLKTNYDNIKEGIKSKFYVKLNIKNSYVYYNINYEYMKDSLGRSKGELFVLDDVTEIISTNEKLEKLANCDQLTGLFNRISLNNKILELEKESLERVSVVICHIQGVKLINDIFGENEGDRLIKYVSEVIVDNMRSCDFVARTDTDEEIILMPEISEAEAEEVFMKINICLSESEEFKYNISIVYGVYSAKNGITINDAIAAAKNEASRRAVLASGKDAASVNTVLVNSIISNAHDSKDEISILEKIGVGFGKYLKLEQTKINAIKLMAELHDIGKLTLPPEILGKPSRLTKEEWDIIKLHTIKGYHIACASDDISVIAEYILYHHERWDGEGYIYKLKGEKIPEISRIFAIVETYVVMTCSVDYRLAVSSKEEIEELEHLSGKQFDPFYTEKFIEYINLKSTKDELEKADYV